SRATKKTEARASVLIAVEYRLCFFISHLPFATFGGHRRLFAAEQAAGTAPRHCGVYVLLGINGNYISR
ncbi:MAG: hypothetical protein IJR52_09135, partial [Selenomonadaceae bacterium]|nr:hypothetical protein [Selenomonadaceae bacterium]